jgi:hypothetical protein
MRILYVCKGFSMLQIKNKEEMYILIASSVTVGSYKNKTVKDVSNKEEMGLSTCITLQIGPFGY